MQISQNSVKKQRYAGQHNVVQNINNTQINEYDSAVLLNKKSQLIAQIQQISRDIDYIKYQQSQKDSIIELKKNLIQQVQQLQNQKNYISNYIAEKLNQLKNNSLDIRFKHNIYEQLTVVKQKNAKLVIRIEEITNYLNQLQERYLQRSQLIPNEPMQNYYRNHYLQNIMNQQQTYNKRLKIQQKFREISHIQSLKRQTFEQISQARQRKQNTNFQKLFPRNRFTYKQ